MSYKLNPAWHPSSLNFTFCDFKFIIQSNLCKEVTFGTKKKWSFKTGDILKEVQNMKLFVTGQVKCDLLIQVTAWAGLTVTSTIVLFYSIMSTRLFP